MEDEILTGPETAEVVDIQFRAGQKVYYFDPAGHHCKAGDHVIIDTARGPEYGICAAGNHRIPTKDVVAPLRCVLRHATAEDERTVARNRAEEKRAFDICMQKIEEHGLDMQLVSAEYSFDGSKILFFFTADERVDFRELVKNLASIFHTRIELRQIGMRDEAKMLGGLGPCGRPICCGSFLGDFQPVSIKMAKEQNLSLNPTKISGVCGRLMCCLKFEQDHYESTRKRMPKIGKEVETPEGNGVVIDINVLKETLTVRIHKGDTSEFKTFALEEVKWQRPAQPAEKRSDSEARTDSKRQPRKTRNGKPVLSSDPVSEAETVQTDESAFEEEMRPVEQSSDWLRAVEEALNAANAKK